MPSYAERSYWEERFESENEFEWLMGTAELAKKVFPLLRLSPMEDGFTVLNAGCGTSRFPADFAALYPAARVVSVDFSETVVRKMSDRYRDLDRLEFRVDDLLKLDTVEPESVDLVFDKSSFDALACTGSREVLANYQRSLARVVKPGGQWALISYSDRTDYVVEGWRLATMVEVVTREAQVNPARPAITHFVHVLEPARHRNSDSGFAGGAEDVTGAGDVDQAEVIGGAESVAGAGDV
ncbi:S-adenosyl-L-methionine-dependent methyltransferase [Hyaloraphidium curvatum]|nr:S-adenosyl-L-methionine-dependent methyltransferase [Hyaloraphidium curvatum]